MAKTREKHIVVDKLDVVKSLRLLNGSEIEVNSPMNPVAPLFVDTVNGLDTHDGSSWGDAFQTMAAALAAVQTNGTIFFRGSVAEQLTGSNLKFDVTIVGVGSLHHADVPAAGYHPGAAAWVTAGTATTPLIKVRGRGWKFINIMFDAPSDAAAIYLERNALSGTDEYDASHASIIGCDFRNGKHAIQDVGGCFNVLVEDCVFETFDATSGCAIINTSAAVANPRRWTIRNNHFQMDASTEGNLQHIDSPLNGSLITGNVFGTVKSTGIYVDLTGGTGNVVCDNILGGVYDTSDYVAGTGDLWYQNRVAVVAVTAPDGMSLAAPAAP
jgi:hypothetical protein